MATKTKYVDRDIPNISLAHFDDRIEEITRQLVYAAENIGFFALRDHGISKADIESMFSRSENFFKLSDDAKATVPWNPQNVGWEKM